MDWYFGFDLIDKFNMVLKEGLVELNKMLN